MTNLSRFGVFFLAAALALFPLSAVQGAGSTFPDVEGHWAEAETMYLENAGVVSGLPDGTFGVNETITRAQAATLIANEQGLTGEPAPYPDVSPGHWANEYIGAITAAGVMSGFPDGNFYPDEVLTRAEAATILVNAYQFSGTTQSPTFSDVAGDHWAFAAIETLVANYIAAGYPDGTFKPQANVTRGEFAVFVARALNPVFTEQVELLSMTAVIMEILQDEDMDAFQDYVHPAEGVRFSPYNYVENDHLVFNAGDIPNLLADPTVYTWGIEDGTGFPLEKTAQEYFDRYVNRKDYSNPDEIHYNTIIQRGSLLYNITDFYPDASFVEYFVEGTAQYGGMDWGSLFVVYEEYQGDWYVVGIVNAEWTI